MERSLANTYPGVCELRRCATYRYLSVIHVLRRAAAFAESIGRSVIVSGFCGNALLDKGNTFNVFYRA
jgi:hypothetical protein